MFFSFSYRYIGIFLVTEEAKFFIFIFDGFTNFYIAVNFYVL